MKSQSFLLCIILAFPAGDGKKEQHALFGDWKLVALEIAGEKSSPAGDKNADFIRATITKDKIKLSYGLNGNHNTEELKYKVDDGRSPKWLDLDQASQTIQAIYSLDKDTLKVCLAPGPARPKEFTAPKGSQRVLAVFNREKKQ